jgi:hypothetical protein
MKISDEGAGFRNGVRNSLDSALTDQLRDAARKRTSLWQDIDSAMAWQRILHAKG